MGHSSVEFHGRQVLMNDHEIRLAAFFIIDQRKNAHPPISVPSNLDQLFTWWNESLWTSGVGCLDLRFNDFLSDGASIEIVIKLIDGAISKLRQFGKSVSADVQNQILGAQVVSGDRSTADLIKALEQIRTVLSG